MRAAATFNSEIAAKFGTHGLEKMTVIDDESNLIHEISINYLDRDGVTYRELVYSMFSTVGGLNKVNTWTNEYAEGLLYRMLISLTGNTVGKGVQFNKDMILLDDDEAWDDVTGMIAEEELEEGRKKEAAAKTKAKKESAKKESAKKDK